MLPRGATSLEMFKFRLHGALNKLVYWKVYLPMAGGVELYNLYVPCHASETIL